MLEGRWDDAEVLIARFGMVYEEDVRRVKFAIRRQKYLELLEAKKSEAALSTLRNELVPLAPYYSYDMDHLNRESSQIAPQSASQTSKNENQGDKKENRSNQPSSRTSDKTSSVTSIAIPIGSGTSTTRESLEVGGGPQKVKRNAKRKLHVTRDDEAWWRAELTRLSTCLIFAGEGAGIDAKKALRRVSGWVGENIAQSRAALLVKLTHATPTALHAPPAGRLSTLLEQAIAFQNFQNRQISTPSRGDGMHPLHSNATEPTLAQPRNKSLRSRWWGAPGSNFSTSQRFASLSHGSVFSPYTQTAPYTQSLQPVLGSHSHSNTGTGVNLYFDSEFSLSASHRRVADNALGSMDSAAPRPRHWQLAHTASSDATEQFLENSVFAPTALPASQSFPLGASSSPPSGHTSNTPASDSSSPSIVAASESRIKSELHVISWSPCGRFLAAGSSSGLVYIFALQSDCVEESRNEEEEEIASNGLFEPFGSRNHSNAPHNNKFKLRKVATLDVVAHLVLQNLDVALRLPFAPNPLDSAALGSWSANASRIETTRSRRASSNASQNSSSSSSSSPSHASGPTSATRLDNIDASRLPPMAVVSLDWNEKEREENESSFSQLVAPRSYQLLVCYEEGIAIWSLDSVDGREEEEENEEIEKMEEIEISLSDGNSMQSQLNNLTSNNNLNNISEDQSRQIHLTLSPRLISFLTPNMPTAPLRALKHAGRRYRAEEEDAASATMENEVRAPSSSSHRPVRASPVVQPPPLGSLAPTPRLPSTHHTARGGNNASNGSAAPVMSNMFDACSERLITAYTKYVQAKEDDSAIGVSAEARPNGSIIGTPTTRLEAQALLAWLFFGSPSDSSSTWSPRSATARSLEPLPPGVKNSFSGARWVPLPPSAPSPANTNTTSNAQQNASPSSSQANHENGENGDSNFDQFSGDATARNESNGTHTASSSIAKDRARHFVASTIDGRLKLVSEERATHFHDFLRHLAEIATSSTNSNPIAVFASIFRPPTMHQDLNLDTHSQSSLSYRINASARAARMQVDHNEEEEVEPWPLNGLRPTFSNETLNQSSTTTAAHLPLSPILKTWKSAGINDLVVVKRKGWAITVDQEKQISITDLHAYLTTHPHLLTPRSSIPSKIRISMNSLFRPDAMDVIEPPIPSSPHAHLAGLGPSSLHSIFQSHLFTLSSLAGIPPSTAARSRNANRQTQPTISQPQAPPVPRNTTTHSSLYLPPAVFWEADINLVSCSLSRDENFLCVTTMRNGAPFKGQHAVQSLLLFHLPSHSLIATLSGLPQSRFVVRASISTSGNLTELENDRDSSKEDETLENGSIRMERGSERGEEEKKIFSTDSRSNVFSSNPPSDIWIASGAEDAVVRMWHWQSGTEGSQSAMNLSSSSNAISGSTNASNNNNNARTSPSSLPTAHTAVINDVAWHPKIPFLLASAADDTTVRLWTPTSFENEEEED